MPTKLEFISTKEPKWHIYYKKQPNSNEGDVIVYKCNGEEMPLANEITGCESNMGNINQYITFYGKVIDDLNTAYHLMPFKDNNVPKEAITGKMLIKLEEAIQNAINNNEEFNGICGICSWNCKIDAPHRADCKSVKIIRALYKTYKINHYQNNIPAEIDTFKLESEHQAATAMVEANMAEFHAEQQEIKEKEREEREALIAEASRLTGRVEAFGFMSKVATVSHLMTLKKIKDSGIYKELPNIKTWEEYCKSIGYTRRHIDDQLESLNLLGSEFLETGFQFGLGYRDLKQLKKEIKAGNLEVKDAEVIIDGEVIPLDDKDELRDALDTLLKSKYKEIEEKDKLLKEKEIQLSVVRETKDGFARRMDKAEEEAEKYKKEINVLNNNIEQLKNNKPSFKNVSEADSEDFNKLLTLESDWRDLFNALKNATDDDKLSSFNKSMLGGIVAQILVMLDDFRMQLNGKSEFYFHGVNIDEEHLNNQISPSDYLAMQNEK